MTEKMCPMCRKHKLITSKRMAWTIIKGKKIQYEETICFCPTLGMNDPESCFISCELMDENLEAARRSYEESEND